MSEQINEPLSEAVSDRLRWWMWLIEQQQDDTMGELVLDEEAPPDPNT